MGQSLTQMPKKTDFKICGWEISIMEHKARGSEGLYGRIVFIVEDPESNRDTIQQFEKYGISFEAAIECCAEELEENPGVLAWFISWEYDMGDSGFIAGFSESEAGRSTATQLMEKIRSCDNWVELYDELHHSSRFQKEMKSKILKELEQCPKV